MKLKKLFPRTLFSRLILILVIPTVVIQILTIYAFYQKHWDVISTKLIQGLISEIDVIDKKYDAQAKDNLDKNLLLKKLEANTGFSLNFYPDEKISKKRIVRYRRYNPAFTFDPELQFRNELLSIIKTPIRLKRENKTYHLYIQKNDGILEFLIPKKRIISNTTRAFIIWNIVVSIVMSLIAIIFLKNQIKSIKKLTLAAKLFSENQDSGYFRPTGAKEIREAGFAFINMRDKIKKFVEQRTRILAGISHDLRTPLTRIKLQLEIMEENDEIKYIKADIEEMEKMINEYLAFAKGERGEEKEKVNIQNYFKSIVYDYIRFENDIQLINKVKRAKTVYIKKTYFKRSIQNIINNAFKYGNKVIITLKDTTKSLIIEIEDNGNGVSDDELKKISEPFYKIDNSRNSKDSGVGLGLAISKDIIQSHGGNISFSNSKELGGLAVKIKIPLKQKY